MNDDGLKNTISVDEDIEETSVPTNANEDIEEISATAAVNEDIEEMSATAAVDEDIEESSVPDDFTFKRTIIAESEDCAAIPEQLEYAVYRTSKVKLFFTENPVLTAVTLICAFSLITVFFFIGYSGKNNNEAVEKKYAELRETNNKYNMLFSDTNNLGEEIDSLTLERDRMKNELDTLKEYDSRSEEIAAQIASLEAEIESIKADSAAKQDEINQLAGSITSKTASIVNLSSGIYTVGENITEGKYLVTGSGKILVSNAKGGVKINTILTADATEIQLDNNDKIQLDTRAKFTPAQIEQGGEQQ